MSRTDARWSSPGCCARRWHPRRRRFGRLEPRRPRHGGTRSAPRPWWRPRGAGFGGARVAARVAERRRWAAVQPADSPGRATAGRSARATRRASAAPRVRRLCRSSKASANREHGRYGLERFRQRQHRQWRRCTRSIADRVGCPQQRLDHLCQPQGIRADRSGDAAPRCGAAVQVRIEATIAEATLQQHGLQWFFNSGDSSFAFTTLTFGAVASVFPGFNDGAECHQRQGRAERAHPDYPGQGDLLAEAAGAGQAPPMASATRCRSPHSPPSR